jgi:hypothetical protein
MNAVKNAMPLDLRRRPALEKEQWKAATAECHDVGAITNAPTQPVRRRTGAGLAARWVSPAIRCENRGAWANRGLRVG